MNSVSQGSLVVDCSLDFAACWPASPRGKGCRGVGREPHRFSQTLELVGEKVVSFYRKKLDV